MRFTFSSAERRVFYWCLVLAGFFVANMLLARFLNISFLNHFAMIGPTMICGLTALMHKKVGTGWGMISCVGLFVGFFGNPDEPGIRAYTTTVFALSPVIGFLASKLDSFIWKR